MLKARIDALMLKAGAHSPFYCGISPRYLASIHVANSG